MKIQNVSAYSPSFKKLVITKEGQKSLRYQPQEVIDTLEKVGKDITPENPDKDYFNLIVDKNMEVRVEPQDKYFPNIEKNEHFKVLTKFNEMGINITSHGEWLDTPKDWNLESFRSMLKASRNLLIAAEFVKAYNKKSETAFYNENKAHKIKELINSYGEK